METVNVGEAKSQLSRLLDRVETGEEVVLGRRGRPVARLVPAHGVPREPGRRRGQIRVGDDFDDPLPAELATAFGTHER